MTYLDGEGPVTREEARERVKGWIDKPEHAKHVDIVEDALDDPTLIEGPSEHTSEGDSDD